MENSLTLQSRKLIEKLNLRKGLNLKENTVDYKHHENISSNDNLLFNSNNLRQNRSTKMTIEHNIADSYPKSSITSIVSRSAYLSKSMPKRLPFGMLDTALDQLNSGVTSSKAMKNSDLLGYDWIAGMLENKTKESQLDKPPEYFEELDKFRRQNKQFCVSADTRESSHSNPILQTSDYKKIFDNFNYGVQHISQGNCDKIIEEQPHVYAYTLNERLFPVALDLETAARGPPDSNNPHIIKVSIPSNRFIHRNQKLQSMKDKSSLITSHPSTANNIGESLSLSSHCHPSGKVSQPVSQNDKFTKSITSSRQEPAGLVGNIILQSPDVVDNLQESVAWFGHSQPKTEREAIEQLKRGKTGAKLSRLIPSSLENRSFNVESIQSPLNICKTRIVLKDMIDDSNPREPKSFTPYNSSLKVAPSHTNDSQGEVPRFSLSRKEMSKVYVDEIENVMSSIVSK